MPIATPRLYKYEGIRLLSSAFSKRGTSDFKLSIAYIGPPLPQLSAFVKHTVPHILTKL